MKQSLLSLALALTVACSTVPAKPPVVTPPVVVTHTENMTAVPGAVGTLTLDVPGTGIARGGPYDATAGADGRLSFTLDVPGPWGEWLTVVAPGDVASTTRLTMCASDCEQPIVVLHPAFPEAPTRAQVLDVKLTFQGLTACTDAFGCMPWFEPALGALTTLSDRHKVYTTKHALGDTHQIVEFTAGGLVYGEPPYYQSIGTINWEASPAVFLTLVEEIIQNGFTPIIAYDGDAGDLPQHGHANALRQLPILANLLAGSSFGDLNRYVVYARFWDSVFYGSSPQHIHEFATAFRAILPNGYLIIECSIGHICVGGGPGDYTPSGLMNGYDGVFMEFPNWPETGDAVFQVLGRMLGPAYHRPPEQTATDDPRPPFYLGVPTPRGPWVFICASGEWAEYSWTHDSVTPAQIATGAAWYKARGCVN